MNVLADPTVRSKLPRPLLVAAAMTKRYGGVCAVDGVDLIARQGEIVGLVGPNGAGKSTLLAAISGHLPHDGGQIELDGVDITSERAHVRAKRGIRRTFQVSRLLPGLSVLDNVRAGALETHRVGVLAALFTSRRSAADQRQLEGRAMEALRVVGLCAKSELVAQELSYGDLRLVEVARALIGEPTVLLLDEPAAGLNTAEAYRLGETIEVAVAGGAAGAVVVVEHNLPLVVRISHRMCVLNFGALISEGPPNVVVDDPRVREAYTGG